MTDAAQELTSSLEGVDEPNERAKRASAAILRHLEARGLQMTVVGGSAVALWDPLVHVSRDIDLVGVALPMQVDEVLVGEFGFEKHGRHWVHDRLGLAVEVPAWVLEPDGAAIATIDGIRVISLEDLILDRVDQWHATGAFEAWRQASRLLAHPRLDRGLLNERASQLGTSDALTAVECLAAVAANGQEVESAMSHAVHLTLEHGGIAAVRSLLSA